AAAAGRTPRRGPLSLRQGQSSDPLRARRPAALEGAGARRRRAVAPDARARRRIARGQRVRARPPPRGTDELRWAAGRPRSEPRGAPPGKAILWLQLPEAPRVIKGDAAGEIATTADGRWTEPVRERFADRVEGLVAAHIDGLRESVLARRVYSPADLEAMNINLVGGDPYGGFCGLDQFFVWRPFKTSLNHRTHVAKLYHIGASTHPGPGLGAGSGFLLAQSLA